jgi:hypothetical protein
VISVIISTIGCPFLLDSLDSMKHPFGQVLVVLDKVGRACSTLDEVYPLPVLEEELAKRGVDLVYYDAAPGTWAVQNGCYNVGARHAIYDWLLFTHDDVTWHPFDYEGALRPALEKIASEGILGRLVPGVIIPEYEVANQVLVPTFPVGTTALTQAVSPVSQVLSRAAYEAIGGFDEEFGIWYDGQLEHETILRDWWWLHLPLPPLTHESNKTYRVNNWGKAWEPNPKWGHHTRNFEAKYGVAPATRKLSIEDAIPLSDK